MNTTEGTVGPAGPTRAVTLRTARLEQIRALPYGFLQSCATSFFLLIAVKQFDASPTAKSLVAAATGIGQLSAPWIVAATRRFGVTAMSAAAGLCVAGAAALLTTFVTHGVNGYIAGTIVALACSEAIQPLVTTVYSRNYGAHERGRWVARAGVIRVAFIAAIGPVVGGVLRRDISSYHLVLGAGVGAFMLSAVLFRLVPSAPIPPAPGGRRRGTVLLPDFRPIKTDRVLRAALMAWMFTGFANMMVAPLRVEYLASTRYGIHADAGQVAMLTVTVPALVRLACTPFFGRMFDRLSFFSLRVCLNVVFAVAILTFFTGTSTFGLYLGAAIYGIGNAGGDLMWGIWVIKFAPPEKVADYMGLHTFFTGFRAVLAPFVAFRIIQSLSLPMVGLVCTGLIGIATVVLLREIRTERADRRAGQIAPAS